MLKRKTVSCAGGRYKKKAKSVSSRALSAPKFKRLMPTRNKFNQYSKITSISKPVYNWHNSYMPTFFRTKLVWALSDATTTLTIGAAGFYDWVLRGNSIYDPDVTGAGRTVRGHTELAAIYAQYRVLGSRCTVRASFTDVAGTAKAANVYLYPLNNATGIVNFSEAQTAPNAVKMYLEEGGGSKQVSNYCSTPTMFAMSSCQDYTFSAAMAANPSLQWFWRLVVTGVNTDKVSVYVTIEYDVLLFDLKATYGSAL